MLNKKNQIILFGASIFVQLLYYISAFSSHILNIFYAPITVGQDFFQIPNGAYAFLHGGTLTGIMLNRQPIYSSCCNVNHNVYHPLFTLLVGIPLQLFPPWTAYALWGYVHLAATAILAVFLWRKFRKHRYIFLSLSLLLFNSYWYYEIEHAQYHFLFVFFTVLFVVESTVNGDTKKAGLWLLCSLLVKPIGLLWIIPLLLYKRYKTVAIGIGIFVFLTLIFVLFPFGQYYIRNLLAVSQAIVPTHNIYALHYLIPSFPLGLVKLLSFFIAVGLLLFQYIKRPSLFLVICLWCGYQLLFYPLVYHYQYSVFAGLICLGILVNEFVPNSAIMFPIVFLTLPAFPALFFHLSGEMPIPRVHLAIIWLYSAFLLICLLLLAVLQVLKRGHLENKKRN